MIDAIIILLNLLVLVFLGIALGTVALIVMIVLADLKWYCGLISMDWAWLREKRARIKEAARVREIAKLEEDIRMLKKSSQDKLRAEKEASAELLWGFYEESYNRGFDSDGNLLYRGFAVTDSRSAECYRKLDELADTLIYENTKEL